MNIELTRFRVKKGKSKLVDEWMKFLNDHMHEVLLTLEDEKMYVETIFRENLDGQEYLYWYSIQGDAGQDVEESEHWVDKKHLEFWEECIDPTFRTVDLNPEVVMIPKRVKESFETVGSRG
ncbi:DUF6176 family protein [Lederbergia galactosidilytica]|uniref:Uncharacterized protein n=1 Tax=Lederbergia galactosidilytica TaxID=217031 RepID=A0A177ZSW7_9BACI|nr:DUF6176 family protein [Lederbergia galactosidilytica]KRG13744.1 hypothetical protein ACA30_14700 [Virgibacillus soli]OAK70733.1 hypothetical protein ABB05_12200 [Lederbergia galactosidilytica]